MPHPLSSLVWSAFWLLVHVLIQTSPWVAGIVRRLTHRAYHWAVRTPLADCPLAERCPYARPVP